MIADSEVTRRGKEDEKRFALSNTRRLKMHDDEDGLRCLLTASHPHWPEVPIQMKVYSNIAEFPSNLLVTNWLAKASEKSGNSVELRPEYAFCPVMMGEDSNPVFLYHFVEVVEELLAYKSVQEELPTLSITQIGGAIAYLRKVAQFNTKDVDIDALEDSVLVNDEGFLSELKQGLEDREIARVLNFSK